MRNLLLFSLLFPMIIVAQPSVSGKILVPDTHDANWIGENTKVVLLTKTRRDTVSLSTLTYSFPEAEKGKAYLYLVSPELPSRTSYKFRIRKNKPTVVDLRYDKFEELPPRREKSPEEKQDDLMKGLLIARIAVDVFLIFKHLK